MPLKNIQILTEDSRWDAAGQAARRPQRGKILPGRNCRGKIMPPSSGPAVFPERGRGGAGSATPPFISLHSGRSGRHRNGKCGHGSVRLPRCLCYPRECLSPLSCILLIPHGPRVPCQTGCGLLQGADLLRRQIIDSAPHSNPFPCRPPAAIFAARLPSIKHYLPVSRRTHPSIYGYCMSRARRRAACGNKERAVVLDGSYAVPPFLRHRLSPVLYFRFSALFSELVSQRQRLLATM